MCKKVAELGKLQPTAVKKTLRVTKSADCFSGYKEPCSFDLRGFEPVWTLKGAGGKACIIYPAMPLLKWICVDFLTLSLAAQDDFTVAGKMRQLVIEIVKAGNIGV